jgi:hypothetical protein
MSAYDPQRTCQQPQLAAGKEKKCPASGETGWACSRDAFGDGGPREKPIRRYKDKNLFVVISSSVCSSFTQLSGFLFQQPEDRPPLAFTGFRIKEAAVPGDILFADKPVQIV